MNYSSISQTYSIIPIYSSKEDDFNKELPKVGGKIVFVHEGTPLLYRKPKKHRQNAYNSIINWKVILLFLIFTLGLSIGIYLLVVEYQEQSANFRYNLIGINKWYSGDVNESLFSNETVLQLPVTNVIVSHTRGDHCYTAEKCSTLINSMIQADRSDIPYNFLISGAGDSYEIRGWNYASEFPAVYNKNESIVVGFIGNFTTIMPTDKQLAELDAFINEAIRRRHLYKNYYLYGVESDLKMHEGLMDIDQWNDETAYLCSSRNNSDAYGDEKQENIYCHFLYQAIEKQRK